MTSARALVGVLACTAGAGAQQPEDLSEPAGEHEMLAALVGEWRVFAARASTEIGTASGRMRLDGRFLEIEVELAAGPIGHALYTFGFDRRHDEFTVVALDDSGTYGVHGRGARDGDRIAMYGTDDDPVMTRMGLTKEFAIVLDLTRPSRPVVETLFIDTRTPERHELPFTAYELRRAGGEGLSDGAVELPGR